MTPGQVVDQAFKKACPALGALALMLATKKLKAATILESAEALEEAARDLRSVLQGRASQAGRVPDPVNVATSQPQGEDSHPADQHQE